MTDNLQQSVKEVDKDLSHSWIDLSSNVRNMAADLKMKTAGTTFAGETSHLAQETARLCDHLERLHSDVIDLLENIETRVPVQETDATPQDVPVEEIEKESIQLQRERHEMRSDFTDILKALFLWQDDPAERVRNRK